MPLVQNIDFVLAPKVTLTYGLGILSGLCVGTLHYLFIIPKENIGGIGRTNKIAEYELNGKSVAQSVEEMLKETGINKEQLEHRLKDMLCKLPDGEEKLMIEINKLQSFKVKSGFFRNGIYFKRNGDKGFRGIAISGTKNAELFSAFYKTVTR